MSFEIDIGYTSSAGRKEHNEDFAGAMLPAPGQEGMGLIAAIADGVSAGGLGLEAAQTTVDTLVRDYHSTPPGWDTTVALDRLITAHNTWLAAQNQRRAPQEGLCTLTAVVLRGHQYTVAHVGDSRLFLVRGGQLHQLTTDHVRGLHDFQHQLVRAVGADERVRVDYLQGELQVGDTLILSTDGVHGSIRLRQMAALAEAGGAAQVMSANLVQTALQMGSQDNATALVIRVLGLLDATLGDVQRHAQGLPVPERLAVGAVVDGLRIQEVVADNGIHLVYRVRDAQQRDYALKTLHPARARDADEVAMLAHEAWLATSLQGTAAGAHLVHLHAHPPQQRGQSSFYLLYDWQPGQTLQELLEHGQPLPVAQVLEWGCQAARALGRLHRQRVVHRDIKPGNLHWGEDGVLRLLDLGVALSGHEPESLRELHAGTPSYINPEQWGFAVHEHGVEHNGPRQASDPGSDLYALGVTLYQLLSGARLPYGEVLPYQSGRYWRDPQALSRHRPDIPIWLDHLVCKAVARKQRQRFETAEELLLALERGGSRPLPAPGATPLLQRDPSFVWKLATGVLALVNLLLVYWLLFLPK